MIVKNVKINGDVVEISVENERFNISLETYIENPVVIGNEINENNICELKNADKLHCAKKSLVSKLYKHRLSQIECEEYLSEFWLEKKDIQNILEALKKSGLINDCELAESIIHYCQFQKKGINVIKDKLLKRKICCAEISIYEYIDQEKYENSIKYLINKYRKMSKNKSMDNTKNYLRSKLLENGYKKEEFECFLVDIDIDEMDIIKLEITSFFKKHEYNKENVVKIRKKLLSKGFKYDIINTAIRECDYNEND